MALRTLVTDLEMSAAGTTKAASIGQDVGLSWVGAGAVMGLCWILLYGTRLPGVCIVGCGLFSILCCWLC